MHEANVRAGVEGHECQAGQLFVYWQRFNWWEILKTAFGLPEGRWTKKDSDVALHGRGGGEGELGKNEKKNGRYLMKNERARIVREELKTKIEKNENARIFTTDI